MKDPNRYVLSNSGLTAGQTRDVASHLLEGAIIIYPTDTLYAVGCCALDGAAVSRLRLAKGREEDKPLPVIACDLAQARALSARWPPGAQRLADAFWPGPLTLVVPAATTLPFALVAGGATIAVRVPGSDVARALAKAAGPLVATSANLAGDPPCLTVDEALRAFPLAALVVDAGPLDGSPSTIVSVDSQDDGFKILRRGRIDQRSIEKALGATP